VRRNGTGVALESSGVAIAPPASLAGALARLDGGTVTVGVRPEDLVPEAAGGGAIPAQVEVREPLGNEVLVHWTTPVGSLLSRIPGQVAPAVGENRTLHFASEKLHLFDPKTEQALDGSLS